MIQQIFLSALALVLFYRIFKTTYMLTKQSNQVNHAYARNRSPHDFVIRCHLLANVQSSLSTALRE